MTQLFQLQLLRKKLLELSSIVLSARRLPSAECVEGRCNY